MNFGCAVNLTSVVIKKMKELWDELGVFEVTKQKLSDQERAIRTNGWLTELEIEEKEDEVYEKVKKKKKERKKKKKK